MPARTITIAPHTELTAQVIQFGTQSFVGVYIRSGDMSASSHVTTAAECDAVADLFRELAAELRAAADATPSPALVAALAADERKAA